MSQCDLADVSDGLRVSNVSGLSIVSLPKEGTTFLHLVLTGL